MEKKLYKDLNNKMVCGICSGVAKYFNLDVTLVRLAVVLISLLFAGMGGVIAYIIAYFVIPDEPAATEEAPVAEDTAE